MNTSIDNNDRTGDIVGRMIAGYQGWFACPGDGSPNDRWTHWTDHGIPEPGNQKFELYPDLAEYERTYPTGYENLGSGHPARLFSSYDDQVVDTHFRWMREYGVDVAALQRFGPSPQHDGMALKVRKAAEAHGRKFYIMYDISGWNKFAEQICGDWTRTLGEELDVLSSTAYAHQDGKPVVCIWGMGFTDRPGSAEECLRVVRWFVEQGCYVIGGVPNHFRDSDTDSKPDFVEVYEAFDMLSPWTPGRYRGTAGVDWYRKTMLEADAEWCRSRGIDYLPWCFRALRGPIGMAGRETRSRVSTAIFYGDSLLTSGTSAYQPRMSPCSTSTTKARRLPRRRRAGSGFPPISTSSPSTPTGCRCRPISTCG